MAAHVKFLLLSVALSFSISAIAQQRTTSTSSARTAEITIRGCVNGTMRYTLTQPSTGAVFELIGDTARFAEDRGKLIEITGNEYRPQPNSMELPKLRANSFRVIANECPIEANGASGTASPAASRGAGSNSGPAATTPYADPGAQTQTPPNVNNPNITGDTGSPSPGTGNPPPPPPPQ
jgi:hypothetical protein